MASQGAVDHLISAEVAGTAVAMSNVPTYIATLELANTTAAMAYVQIFWLASGSVTPGTTVPNVVIGLPASGGAVLQFGDEGWKTLGTAWSMIATTTRTGSTGAAVSVTVWKKR